jgi:hypothetical protein
MHLVYIDDSKDPGAVCFSAILIPAVGWQGALDHLIALRRQLWESDRIYIRKELHATDFVGGRGRISPKYVIPLIAYVASSI